MGEIKFSQGVKKVSENKALRNEMKIKLPSLSVNESVARVTVAAFCAQLNPNATELADIKCAVSEAVTNCIVHAYKNTCGMIYISIRLYDDKTVRIEIKDKGCGIENVKQAREPLFTTDAENERSGMGFTVMESFMDKISVSAHIGKGTKVILTKRIGENSIK